MSAVTQPDAPDGRQELTGLTAWRGVAAILVVLYHLDGLFRAVGQDLALGPFTAVIERGYAFVDMFFILSGFVIAHVYGQRNLLERGALRRFLALRLGRIYPLHLFVIALLLVLPLLRLLQGDVAFSGSMSLGSLLTELLLLDSIGLHDGLTWNEVSWSVSAEWISYLLAPVLLLLVRGRRVSNGAVGVVLAMLWVGLFLLADDDGYLGYEPFRIGWIRGVLGFTMGICTYRLSELPVIRRLSGQRGAVVVSAIAVVAAATVSPHDALLTPFFLVLIVTSIASTGSEAQLLSSAPMRWLGDISYSTYMLQQVFLIGTLNVMARVTTVFSPVALWAITVVWLLALIGVSSLTYRCIEVPARDAVRGKVRARTALHEREPARVAS